MSQPLRDIEPIKKLLSHQPFVVLSDIDGTLAPIVEDPDDAAVSSRAHAALSALIDRGVSVGLVTGRALDRAREMARLVDAVYATNHGLNVWAGGDIEAPEPLREWVVKAQALLPRLSRLSDVGVSVEDKGPIIALHYRRALSKEKALVAIKRVSEIAEAEGFRIQEGRKVVEIRPPIDIDKGTAAVGLARRFGARGVLCMGDDRTDIDMFAGVRSLRSEGVESVIIAVISQEVQDEVLEGADYSVEGVEGIEWLLEEVLSALPEADR